MIVIVSKILASSIDQRIKHFYFLAGAIRLADDQANTPERTALIFTHHILVFPNMNSAMPKRVSEL